MTRGEAIGQLLAALVTAVSDSYRRDQVAPEVAISQTRDGKALVAVTRIQERWAADRERVVGVPCETFAESLFYAAGWVCDNCGAASVKDLRRALLIARSL